MNTILIAILVCLARIVDVSLDTLRLKALIRGNRSLAFIIAFIDIIIYTEAAAYAFKYVSNITVLLMFALGYATGNFIGITIDNKMNKNNIMVLIITNHDEWKMADTLREKGYGVTTTKGYGMSGTQKAELKVIVPAAKLEELKGAVKNCDESAYMVEINVKDVSRTNLWK